MTDKNKIQRRRFLAIAAATGGALAISNASDAQESSSQNPKVDDRIVSLRDAHVGTLEIDLRIMNQYTDQPQEMQDFYVACREAFKMKNPEQAVADVCQQFKRHKLGGPMLGNVTSTSVSVWMHLPQPAAVKVTMTQEKGESKTFKSNAGERIFTVLCEGLQADTAYSYTAANDAGVELGKGQFVTPPETISEKPWTIAFGADFHKVGMYRPELMQLIRERGSRAMMLIGDNAVDGRKDDVAMINTDYMLRNLSPIVQEMVANVPTSATWDDHDYWGNDISGTRTRTRGGKPIDVELLRKTWKTQWNNPQRDEERPGIYFATHFGPIHYIALDTRSCRIHDQKGKAGCFLGEEQMNWLQDQLAGSKTPFILVSGGTMWTDNITAGKDSWGVWDGRTRADFQMD